MSFFISKIFTYLFLPPGLFILLLLLLLPFALKGKRFVSTVLVFLILFSLYFLSIEPGSDLILKSLEDRYPPLNLENLKNVDAIVILGGGLNEGRSPFPEDNLYPKEHTLSRLIYGYFIWKKLMVPIVLSGGRPLMSLPGTEADVMKDFLVRLGVPDSFIIVENRSRNTYENALYSLKICKDSDFKSIVLISSAFHLARALGLFSGKGITVYPAPSSYLTEAHPYTWISFLPHASYLYYSFLGLKERMGMLFYKILPK